MEFTVSNVQEIAAVAALFPQPEGVLVYVGGVPNLDSAPEMRRALLLGASDLGWACPGLGRLNNLAKLTSQLRDVRDRLVPLLIVDPSPFNDVFKLEKLLELENGAWQVRFLGRHDYAADGLPQQGELWAATTALSNLMMRIPRRVLEGVQGVPWMRTRLLQLADMITHLLINLPVALPRIENN